MESSGFKVDILKIEKVQDLFVKFVHYKQFNTDKNIQNKLNT